MKKNPTKRALLTSVFSLALCLAMLVGTTFAWFTDSASTAVNKIEAGKLDIQLLAEDGVTSLEGKTLQWQKAKDAENEKVLWEPGCTYDLQPIVIKNNGTLALKYKIVITGINGDAELNEAIEWTINGVSLDTEKSLPVGTSDTLIISGHMKNDAGNTYQGMTIDGIGITVYAAQDTVESDSTGNQYDAKAEYDKATVYFADNMAALKRAAASIKPGDVLKITDDFTMNGSVYFTTNNFTFDGQGHTITGNFSNLGYAAMLGFGQGNQYCSGILVKDLNVNGRGGTGIYFHGGTTSTMENVKVSGDWHIAVYFFGTHGGLVKNCDISSSYANRYAKSSLFANQQSANQLVLVDTKVDALFINASETGYPTANDGVKLIVDKGSEVGVLHTNKDVTRAFYKTVNGGKIGELLADC